MGKDSQQTRAPLRNAGVVALTTGDAARRTGLTSRAIRFYEDRGLIKPARSPLGGRQFSSDLLARLEVIALARSAGLSIEEISELLLIGDVEGREPRRLRMIELCERKQQDLAQQGRRVAGVLQRLRSGESGRAAG
ncbi:MAG TPA: MerR family transcriptional regulator [Caulobacteraceae bacterium]|nr:MerR family transcriptional regulator [Caulobacteraceae bacterium]